MVRKPCGIARSGGLLTAPTDYLRQVLGESEPEAHDHNLHSSAAMATALDLHGRLLSAEPSAYYFRYAMPALDRASGLAEAFLAHERDMIAAGAIDPMGRRFVAEARA